MNLISVYGSMYSLIKFIGHNADRSGLPLLIRRFFTSKGKPDRAALWPMNLISEYIDPYTLIKFIDHNADRSGLPLLVKKRLKAFLH